MLRLFCVLLWIAGVILPAAGAPGDLDITFGTPGDGTVPSSGMRLTAFPGAGLAEAFALAQAPDGKIVAGGYVRLGLDQEDFAIARYLPGGAPDPAFGQEGLVTATFGDLDSIAALAVQADGKILAGGSSRGGTHEGFTIARFQQDGTLDPSFGTAGFTSAGFGDAMSSLRLLTVLADGKILVGGEIAEGVQVVARLLSDGSPDAAFGGTGRLTFEGVEIVFAGGLPDGGLLLGGTTAGEMTGFRLIRLKESGEHDPAFGNGGVVNSAFPAPARLIAVRTLADGRIVAAGTASYPLSEFSQIALARYLSDGSPDPALEGSGVVAGETLPLTANTVAVRADGGVIVAGEFQDSPGGDSLPAVARFTGNGARDFDFGNSGVAVAPFGQGSGSARAILLPGDNQVLVAGDFSLRFSLARFVDHNQTPEIALEQPAGMNLVNGQVHPLGAVITGGQLAGTFVLRNTGIQALMVGPPAITGPGADHFTVTESPPTVVEGGGTAVFTITFNAPEEGVYAAEFRLPSNDPSENPFTLNLMASALAARAELLVFQPENVRLNPPVTVPFPPAAQEGNTLTFTLRNGGTIPLEFSRIAIDHQGAPPDFTLEETPAASLEPGGSMTMTVKFVPQGPGDRTATLVIESNDPNDTPFSVGLSGRAATRMEAWRIRHFGTSENSGDAADSGDPDHDGVVNLMEYATLGDPHHGAPPPAELVKNGDILEYTISRPAGVEQSGEGEDTGLEYRLEWAGALTDAWSAEGTGAAVLSTEDGIERVKFTAPAGSDGWRFIRLRVSRAVVNPGP